MIARLPQLDKCCAVSRTYGERRLAHHLLTGLELLLGDLVPKSLPDEQVAQLRATFGPERGSPYTESLFDPATCTKSELAQADVYRVPSGAVGLPSPPPPHTHTTPPPPRDAQ